MDGIKSLNDISGLRADSLVKSAEKISKNPEKAKAEKAATDFESLMLHQMLNEMWKTVPKDSLLGGSNEEAQYRDMYTEALAKEIAEKQSIGVKDVLMKDFEKNAKKKELKIE
jgi:flagellar protein FlgJ